eukprot:gene4603-14795_t
MMNLSASRSCAVTRCVKSNVMAAPRRSIRPQRSLIISNAETELEKTEVEKLAEELGDSVEILKVDVDANEELAAALKDASKPALRTEGLLPLERIREIVAEL